MRILQIVFLLSVCGCPQARRLPISDIMEIEKLSKDVTFDLFKMFKLLDKDIGLSAKAKGQSVLFKKFKVFKNKIDKFNAQMELGSLVLDAIELYSNLPFRLRLKLEEANQNIDSIFFMYEDMGTSIENKTAMENLTLEEFGRSIVSDTNSSLQSVLERIHAIITSPEDGFPNVFKSIKEIMKVQGNEMFCKTESSAQQLILYLYKTLALAELRGFLMMEFSYMLLKLQNKGNFTNEIVAAQQRYRYRSATTLKLTIEAAQSAPLEFWKCHPYQQVKNETYIEITELLQGYIEVEEDLNDQTTCLETCDFVDFQDTTSYNCDDYGGEHPFCNKNRQCKGKIRKCQAIADATVCLADAGTNRRYEYIEQAEGKVLGRKKECAHITSFKGWGRFLVNCDYCMCLCDEQGVNSDRYFSLRLSVSEIDDNMVVTGLRFVKKNRIIHLQIQQGKLLPMGKINVTSVRWKPVENFRINGKGIRNGKHYHTLTWEKRGFYLDELVIKKGEVLTGVKLKLIDSGLQLQVHSTHFNFATGTLVGNGSLYRYKLQKGRNRTNVNLNNKDVPIRDPDGSHLFFKRDMYLEFTHTDWDMDVAQTTVPFIDAQAVILAQPVPLSGAGVMYKGSEKFGGFITLKIMTYNYSNVLRNAYDDNIYL